MKYYLLFETCFSTLLEYLLFEKKNGFLIIFYLKRGLTDNPLIKKAKKTHGFFKFFTDPPLDGGGSKVAPAGSHPGSYFGTVAAE